MLGKNRAARSHILPAQRAYPANKGSTRVLTSQMAVLGSSAPGPQGPGEQAQVALSVALSRCPVLTSRPSLTPLTTFPKALPDPQPG